MLDKLGGVFAPKPSPGPHKQRECLPLCLILRNRLKYALTYKEVTTILQQRLVKVDGKVRRDKCYPTGIMDVVTIDKTDDHFRIIYDQKGRFVVHSITALEAQVRTRHEHGFFFSRRDANEKSGDGWMMRRDDPRAAAAGFARRVRLAIGESNRRDVTDAHGIANARAHIARDCREVHTCERALAAERRAAAPRRASTTNWPAREP